MNWTAVAAIGQILGAAAVAGTLIYLSRQVKENSRHLKLASLTDTNSLVAEAFDPLYNNETNLRIWTTGISSPTSLNAADLHVFMLFMTRIMATFDTVAEHHKLKTIDDERFANYVNFAKGFLQTPGGKLWLEQKTYQFSTVAKQELEKGS